MRTDNMEIDYLQHSGAHGVQRLEPAGGVEQIVAAREVAFLEFREITQIEAQAARKGSQHARLHAVATYVRFTSFCCRVCHHHLRQFNVLP